MEIVTGLFMLLVLLGLASIYQELRNRTKNDERLMNRLDLILKELKSRNESSH